MTQQKIYLVILALLFWGGIAFAQTEKREIPEGMEEIQIGGSAKIIVPKGAKTRKVGAQIIVEGTKEYVARRFYELEVQLEEMKQKQIELEAEIKTLKDAAAAAKITNDAKLIESNEHAPPKATTPINAPATASRE